MAAQFCVIEVRDIKVRGVSSGNSTKINAILFYYFLTNFNQIICHHPSIGLARLLHKIRPSTKMSIQYKFINVICLLLAGSVMSFTTTFHTASVSSVC